MTISIFCSTLDSFVSAENRTVIQNVHGVGREGRLSVYRARMAALTQRYRAYVRFRMDNIFPMCSTIHRIQTPFTYLLIYKKFNESREFD